MVDKIFDSTIHALRNSMDLRLQNQNIISSNIANVDTPGYKAQTMEFEQALRESLELNDETPLLKTHPNHISSNPEMDIKADVFDDPNGVESLDGNTVNRGEQMAKLQENQILYDTSAELTKKKLALLKYAITEGGGSR